MSSTVENTNTNILKKIDELKTILNIYDEYDIDARDANEIKRKTILLDEIQNSYEFGSITLLSDYYKHKNNRAERNEIYNDFMKFITTENIIGNLKRVYLTCKRLQKIYDADDDRLYDAFQKYEYAPIIIKYNDPPTGICPCGTNYTIESKNSEYVCHTCGNTAKLDGVVFEDEQFFYQEGLRTKHGKYDPTKHCKFWVDRIQAKETTDIPQRVIHAIKQRVINDRIWLEDLTCPMIRGYLKILKLTQYNDHVSLILKLITGVEPEQLTDSERKLVYIYFARVIQIYNRIKPSDKPNCPYHPFFIYKIIEQILKGSKHRHRRRNILSCIHLQSRETLIENDNIWKLICEEISEFTYSPTDRS